MEKYKPKVKGSKQHSMVIERRFHQILAFPYKRLSIPKNKVNCIVVEEKLLLLLLNPLAANDEITRQKKFDLFCQRREYSFSKRVMSVSYTHLTLPTILRV